VSVYKRVFTTIHKRGVVYLIGGDGCGLASSATLDGATTTAGATTERSRFAMTTGRSGFTATGAGLAVTGRGRGLFRHYI